MCLVGGSGGGAVRIQAASSHPVLVMVVYVVPCAVVGVVNLEDGACTLVHACVRALAPCTVVGGHMNSPVPLVVCEEQVVMVALTGRCASCLVVACGGSQYQVA